MVDRVGNGPGYSYPQVNEKKVNTGATGTGEKFQLDYGKEGAIYEPSSEAVKRQQDEKRAIAHSSDTSKTEDEGVRLTLSSAALNHKEKSETEKNAQGGILDVVTSLVNKVIDAMKGFFSSIWNDTPATNGEETSETDTIAESKAEKIDVGDSTAVPQKPKTKFEEAKAEAEAFLASPEGKKVARNSDLLTYYDKHGTVISVSPSDRQRILYGDKNQIEV